ncbi:methyltransferase CmcJ [Colletotrichum truncatum]|uniref:Methyltransferase CmcJ n=1 Tax=Colletotrichum truncatum TaxID=5467 RepID=A0ACC3Z073_COLTU|nr:methyltransferase CmcJ [Colletotrichum truncatum]KAF6800739.1 methyltransferase CmcJ [Colletotrichum truncatum]
MAHSDFSKRGAFLRMADIFPGQESYYENRKFDLINVWRVLRGPSNDWPLAVCDYSLINAENDITTNDALHYKRIGENSLLYHSDAQRWYYLSNMEEDDLLVFRNVDSDGTMARGFHASFHNPNSAGEFRHSIEVRLVAFRD